MELKQLNSLIIMKRGPKPNTILPSIKSFPSLPSHLSNVFVMVTPFQKKSLIRAYFDHVFKYLLPRVTSFKTVEGIIPYYWCLMLTLEGEDLKPMDLRYLTLVCFLSDNGRRYVTSKMIYKFYPSMSVHVKFAHLFDRGLLIRHSFPPGVVTPFRRGDTTKQYINITSQGLGYLMSLQNKVQTKLYKALEYDYDNEIKQNPAKTN